MKKEILKIVSSPLPAPNNHRTVYLSSYIIERLCLKENSPYTLIFGINSISARIEKFSGKNISSETLWLSEDIFKELLIPEDVTLEVLFTENIIKIGPIIAILTESKYLKDFLDKTECVEDYSLYAGAAEEVNSLIYVFSVKNLNLKDKYINGYLPLKEKNNSWTWHKQPLPMPDIICNRMAAAVSSPAFKNIKNIEKIVPGIKIINRITKISKWKIAEILQGESDARKYIPETVLFNGPEDIIKMLGKYPEIYLKPVRRSLGLGIVKMTGNANGNYTAYYCVNGNNLKTSGSLSEILAELRVVMGKRVYIVQQGIPVALYEECPCDIRVTMQKDGTGEWSLVRWIARVAAPGNIVSNVAAGGRGVSAEKVLRKNFKGRMQELKDEIKKAGIIIAKALDRRIDDIGDLGMDIGIDLEGNTK
jgi:glutathione synthase/RimK-type ligase-like ATP-grasp enzyme